MADILDSFTSVNPFDMSFGTFDMFGGMFGGGGKSGGGGIMPNTGALGALVGDPEIYGRRPKPVKPVTPTDITTQAAGANYAAMPTLETIGQGVDAYNLQQRNRSLQSQIPGYTNLTKGEAGLLSDWQKGIMSPDLQNAVATSAAARAFQGGYGGSRADFAGAARDYGLTSYDLQKHAVAALPTYLNTMDKVAVPDQFNIANGFLRPSYSPYGEYDQSVYNANLAAAADPAAAGAAAAQLGLAESILGIFSGGGERGITRYQAPSQPSGGYNNWAGNAGGGGYGGNWYNSNTENIGVNTPANVGYDQGGITPASIGALSYFA